MSRCNLTLDWIPRESNQLADDLTNEKFDHFNQEDRVRWDPTEQSWHVLDEIMLHANSFHTVFTKRKTEPQAPPVKKRKKVSSLEPW